MLRIVTDGATDMPAGWAEEFEIEIIPLRIRFGEETYIQGVDVTNESFYSLVSRKQQIPQTSLAIPLSDCRILQENNQSGGYCLIHSYQQ